MALAPPLRLVRPTFQKPSARCLTYRWSPCAALHGGAALPGAPRTLLHAKLVPVLLLGNLEPAAA
eukprot:12451987-Alexandrium_andersonii.AAC.1